MWLFLKVLSSRFECSLIFIRFECSLIYFTRLECSLTSSSLVSSVVLGMYVLYWPEIRDLLDLRLFISMDDDTRLSRRLVRDSEKG